MSSLKVPKKSYKFVLYKDAKGEPRWSVVHKNSKKVADGCEGYKVQASLKKSLFNFIKAIKEDNFEIVNNC